MNTFHISAMALFVASCSTGFAAKRSAQPAQPNWIHGFYAGISAGLDSGRIRMKDHSPDYYYLVVRGANAGDRIGYTLMQPPPGLTSNHRAVVCITHVMISVVDYGTFDT